MGLLASLFLISLLIFVHELGHFLAAKKAGVKVEEFGLGYPPQLIGIKRGETVYSLNLVPFGGFTRIDETGFAKKPKRLRAPVLLAGILMNFLLAIFFFTLIYFNLGIPQKTGFVKVIGLAKDSPASSAGIREGDILRQFQNNQQFIEFINQNLEKKIELAVEREQGILLIPLTPRRQPPQNEGPLGVAIADVDLIKPVFWQRPFLSVWWGTKETFDWTLTMISGVSNMFYNLFFKLILPQDISGPVGIVQIANQVVRHGVYAVLQFAAALSVNLAVLNLLPIPALDGGRLLFLFLEIITGKKPQLKWEKRIHTLGMILLLFLMLVITVQDVFRLFPILNGFF